MYCADRFFTSSAEKQKVEKEKATTSKAKSLADKPMKSGTDRRSVKAIKLVTELGFFMFFFFFSKKKFYQLQ